MNQLSIYDLTQEAIDRVEMNANEEWKATALAIVRNLARRVPQFTSDSVWHELDKSDIKTHENRALGAVIIKAIKLGYIEPTGAYQKSTRPECHRRPIAVYASRIPW